MTFRAIVLVSALLIGEPARCDDAPLLLLPPDEVFAETDSDAVVFPPVPDGDEVDDDLRLMQVESSLEQFQSQLDTLNDSLTVTTRDSDWSLTFFGALVGEMIYAEQRPVIPSAILFLSPYTGRDTPTIEIHGKQSSLGLIARGPEIFGMQSGGMVITYFYGESLLNDQYGLFIPRGFAELKNDQWRFAAGALGDIINPRLPGNLDFVTGQGGGNLGAFRGQFRVERYLHWNNDAQLTMQFGLGNPLTTAFVGDIRTLVEDNGWPNVEGRVMLGLGPLADRGPLRMRPFEVALSGLVGQIRRAGEVRALFNVWAVGADARIEFTDRCGVKFEFFHGQALGNYNAAILQIFNPFTLQAIRTTGGWGEFFINWSDSLHSHFGWGVDDPLNQDLSPGLPTRNQFSFANLIWNATKNLEIGFEIGRHQTDYTPGGMIGTLPVLDNEALVYRTRVKLSF